MGRILFGGTAALLICIFLSPKFIEFLREREFGQHIREEGPEGHHLKAGTPTMGGVIIFLGVAPAGRNDPRVVRLGEGLARIGLLTFIPQSQDLVDARIRQISRPAERS